MIEGGKFFFAVVHAINFLPVITVGIVVSYFEDIGIFGIRKQKAASIEA